MKTCKPLILRYKLLMYFIPVVSLILVSSFQSCKIYSFKGSTLSPDIKTFTVEPFVNQASIVVPSLANTFTEKLKEKIIRELNLSHTDQDGQIIFKGFITSYRTGPASVTSSDKAAATRLTVTVRVVFENSVTPDQNFDISFSQYIDFDSNLDLSSIESQLIDELSDAIIQDIFNRAINNW